MDDMLIRPLDPRDHALIISVVNDWWGGRNMRDMLPRLFFAHFCDTGFVASRGGQIAGFLIGFVSQCHPEEAYIHFAGVHPQHRSQGLGKMLYTRFFHEVSARGCQTVRCVTSPVNRGSIAFHLAMGFETEQAEPGMPMPVAEDYDGPGEHRVLFRKTLRR